MDPKRTERQAPWATSTSRNITSGSSMRPFQSFVRNTQKSAVRAPSPSEWPWPGPWLPDPGGPEFAAAVGRPAARLGGLAYLLPGPGQPGALLHAPPPLPGLPWQPRSFLPSPALPSGGLVHGGPWQSPAGGLQVGPATPHRPLGTRFVTGSPFPRCRLCPVCGQLQNLLPWCRPRKTPLSSLSASVSVQLLLRGQDLEGTLENQTLGQCLLTRTDLRVGAK